MIDLTKTRKYYELKWFDGEVLKIPMPTQELLMKVVKIESIKDIEEQFDALNGIVREIINSNINHRVFTDEDFNELDLNITSLILTDYMESINKELGE